MGNLRKEITKEETSILQKIKEDEMPKYLIDRNKKIISFIALLSVILCSFLGIEYDRLSGNMTDNSISQESYASSFTDFLYDLKLPCRFLYSEKQATHTTCG